MNTSQEKLYKECNGYCLFTLWLLNVHNSRQNGCWFLIKNADITASLSMINLELHYVVPFVCGGKCNDQKQGNSFDIA